MFQLHRFSILHSTIHRKTIVKDAVPISHLFAWKHASKKIEINQQPSGSSHIRLIYCLLPEAPVSEMTKVQTIRNPVIFEPKLGRDDMRDCTGKGCLGLSAFGFGICLLVFGFHVSPLLAIKSPWAIKTHSQRHQSFLAFFWVFFLFNPGHLSSLSSLSWSQLCVSSMSASEGRSVWTHCSAFRTFRTQAMKTTLKKRYKSIYKNFSSCCVCI